MDGGRAPRTGRSCSATSGTHIPAKGVQDLIRAFGAVSGETLLRIRGRPRGQNTEALEALVRALPPERAERVEWLPEYRNADIVREVFDRVDAIVVPSIWVENSPLVIHEAQQARVPVIAADAGGMAEYVRHGVNGLLFEHRSRRSLTARMQVFVDDPGLARRLGRRGYLYAESGDIPSIGDHVGAVERVYGRVLEAPGQHPHPGRAGSVADHVRYQSGYLQHALRHVRGAFAPQVPCRWPGGGRGGRAG